LGSIHATHKGACQKASQANQMHCNEQQSCVHFAIICDPVDLDKILEAYAFSDGFFTESIPKLVARYLALLHGFQTTTIACHILEHAWPFTLNSQTSYCNTNQKLIDYPTGDQF
jgi:hypothetical protein